MLVERGRKDDYIVNIRPIEGTARPQDTVELTLHVLHTIIIAYYRNAEGFLAAVGING